MHCSAFSLMGLLTAMGLALPSSNSLRPDQETSGLIQRQASEIPPTSLYLIEWWPEGCYNGNGQTLNGGEETLGACVNTESLWDEAPPDSAAVRFLFPDDGRQYKWRIFATNDCSDQLMEGVEDGCINVFDTRKVGAVIVYT